MTQPLAHKKKTTLHFLPWRSRSIKNKILLSFLVVFTAIYSTTLAAVYKQSESDVLESATTEAVSTARILAVTLFRNFELEDELREIQSYLIGVKRSKSSLLEMTVLNRDLKAISSTNNLTLTKTFSGSEYQSALRNEAVSAILLDTSLEETSHNSSFIRVLHPISAGTNSSNFVSGLLDLKFDMQGHFQHLAHVRQGIFISALLIISIMTLGIIFLSHTITRPIEQLFAGMKQVDEGDLDTNIEVTSQDEIGYLSHTFNNMVNSIRTSHKELEQSATKLKKLNSQLSAMYDSSTRFVPAPFLRVLERDDITEVTLGDARAKEMTVLFADIRNFTRLAEKLSAEQTLSILNSLLAELIPAIEEHGGFVDKFVGDAIMALFPDGSKNAVRAALQMRAALSQYNSARPEEPQIEIGIGINSGDLVLGTIGTTGRIDTTVIGNTVNIASRLEALTKNLSSSIIFPIHVYSELDSETILTAQPCDLGVLEMRGAETPLHLFGIS